MPCKDGMFITGFLRFNSSFQDRGKRVVLEGMRRSFFNGCSIEQGTPDYNRWTFEGMTWNGNTDANADAIASLRVELSNLLRSGALEEFSFHYYDVLPSKTLAYSSHP